MRMKMSVYVAPWEPCPDCPEYWCNIHGMHAFECECPPVEEWDTNPYAPQEIERKPNA
jgi:hypothetical protein